MTNSDKKRNYSAKLAKDLPRSLSYHHSAARKSASKRGIEFSLEKQDIVNLWGKQKGLCAVSKIPLSLEHGSAANHNLLKLSVDRINNNEGYHLSNVHLVTWQVNCAKGTGSLEDLIKMAQGIVLAQKLKDAKVQ